jgi:preprotein translocase subunit SecE
LLEQVARFAREVQAEAKKITWPAYRQTLSMTVVVVVVVLLVTAIIFGLDALFTWALAPITGVHG